MSEIHHTIRAKLYKNPLTEDSNDYIARVNSERSLNVADICQTAVSRGGANSVTTAEAMKHISHLFLKEMAYQLCDGYSVNTQYFTVCPRIKGVFGSDTEHFDELKHKLYFQFAQGEEMRKEIANTTVEIEGIAESGVVIDKVYDVRSETTNDQLTPNRNLRIQGRKLKIAGEDESNGVYFINTETGARTSVDPIDIVYNKPSELIIVIPQLDQGSYQLEVLTQYTKGENLRTPRTDKFEAMLTVS